MNVEEMKSEIAQLKTYVQELQSRTSDAESEVDGLDNQYTVSSVSSELSSISNALSDVDDKLDDLYSEIDQVQPDNHQEHRNAHVMLSANVKDVIALLATAVERFNAINDKTLVNSEFHYENTSEKDDLAISKGVYNIYWLLIDILGYSQLQFEENLRTKTIDYKVTVKETASVSD